MSGSAFPLTWPIGWTRVTGWRPRARFGNGHGTGLTSARNFLFEELRRLSATDVVVSTNLPLRNDGQPRADARDPGDPGVAIYFRLKDEPRVLACDKWDRVADNVMAIAKHVEAVRGQVRWGVGSLEQAFGGYKALPAVGEKQPWWAVLALPQTASRTEIDRKRTELLRKYHPDVTGGSHSMAAEINAAYAEAIAQ